MTKLPTPEQWVLSRMDELECAELIEQYIDFYVQSEDGFRRSVHLEKEFVKHYLQRHDGALPTVVAIATAPLALDQRERGSDNDALASIVRGDIN